MQSFLDCPDSYLTKNQEITELKNLHEEEDGAKVLLGAKGQKGSESINAKTGGTFFLLPLLDDTKTWGV